MNEYQLLPVLLNYRRIFWILAAFLAIFMPVVSLNYGVIEDSELHKAHGELIFNYFAGKDNLAAQSPFDDKGELISSAGVNSGPAMRGMNIFGGFFDLLTTALHRIFSSIGIYEFRNIINALFGFLLFLFTALLAKEFGGWRTAVFALIAIALTPLLFGHSMNNPKDIPFAAFYVTSLFHIVKFLKELPTIKFKRAAYLIINIGILINIRALGLSMIGFFFLATFLRWVKLHYASNLLEYHIKRAVQPASIIILIGLLAYLAASAFWPYSQTNPLKVPLYLFFSLSKFSLFHTIQLFEGKWLSNSDLPWYYIPKYLIITMPLHLLIGAVFTMLLCLKKFITADKTFKNLSVISFILLVALLPIVAAVITNSNAYDNARHFLFTLPPLIAVSAFSLEHLLRLLHRKYVKIAVYAVLALLLLQPFQWMIKNHPLEALYFSPLVGGPNGAFGNYEMDYWGFAVKPAVNWIEKNAKDATPQKPARVRLFYGAQIKASYYIDKIPYLKSVVATADSPDWDYSIVMLSEAKYNPDMLKAWPPPNTVFAVKVDTVTVCAVVTNTIKSAAGYASVLEQKVAANPSAAAYIELSMAYYNAAQYYKSVLASKQALQFDSINSTVYNNLCAAYNCLLMFDEAKAACQKALQLSPSSDLAKNNLKASDDGINLKKNNKFTENQYLILSYNYYAAEKYRESISTCRELLSIYPPNAIAYNNIGSCYNTLNDFIDAKAALEHALLIKPGFDLAKNNLKIAEEGLKK